MKLNQRKVYGIYRCFCPEYDTTYYIGHTHLPLYICENIHRKGQEKYGNKYAMTDFRKFAQDTYTGKRSKFEWIHEPVEMTFEEILTLEGECITEMKEQKQCALNYDTDPLTTWKKYNE